MTSEPDKAVTDPAVEEFERQEEEVAKFRVQPPIIDKHKLSQLWYQFFTGYRRNKKDTEPTYVKVLYGMRAGDKATLTIDYIHVRDFVELYGKAADLKPLIDSILGDFETAMLTAQIALRDVLREHMPDYGEQIKNRLEIGMINIPVTLEIPDIDDTIVGKPVHMQGLITTVDDVLFYVRKAVYKCEQGHRSIISSNGTEHRRPFKCFHEKCGSYNVQMDDVESDSDSFQLVRLQQMMDRVRPGLLPQVIDCYIFGRDRMNLVKPGDFVDVSGMIRVRYKERKTMSSLGTFYLEVTGIEAKEDDFAFEDPELAEAVKKAVRPNAEHVDFERLVRSVAPSIKGHYYPKLACLLLLAGSDSRRMLDGSRHRGDIQLFFEGDTSTGKTKIAKYMIRVFPRSIFNAGRGSTKAGFTAAVDTDPNTGARRLEAGSYPLASSKTGGLVVVDEIEKIDKEDREILAEIMDDEQTHSVHKAGFHKTLSIRAASIHCANPVLTENQGKYDRSRSLLDNSGMEPWLLSRYDAIFVFTDEANDVEDKDKAGHYLAHYGSSVQEDQYAELSAKYMTGDESLWPVAFIRYWGQYVRQTFHPKLAADSPAAKKIEEFYLKMRKGSAYAPITMRDLGALIRFAEASARAHHRNDVTEVDADIAIDIVKTAVATSGFNVATMQILKTGTPAAKGESREAMFIRAIINSATRECTMCGGKGKMKVDSTSAYGIFERDCEPCAGRGQIDGLTFNLPDVIKIVGKKMSNDEISARMHDLQNFGAILWSGDDRYSKIPDRFGAYARRYIPLEEL